MGVIALTSNMKREKHKKWAPLSLTLNSHFQKSTDPIPSTTPNHTFGILDKILLGSLVLQVEIRWALKYVLSSFHGNVTVFFNIMFPAHDISK